MAFVEERIRRSESHRQAIEYWRVLRHSLDQVCHWNARAPEPHPDIFLGEVVERILMPAINDPRHARPKADPVETPS
jgi:hypothetical protein